MRLQEDVSILVSVTRADVPQAESYIPAKFSRFVTRTKARWKFFDAYCAPRNFWETLMQDRVTTHSLELCRQYQEAVTRKDIAAALNLFVPGATVQAPITGTMGAEEFHTHLFNGSSTAIARLTHVFEGIGEPKRTALQFSYTWVLPDGTVEVMDGVSIFELADEDKTKFKSLTIIYDPTNLKRHLNDEQITSTSLG